MATAPTVWGQHQSILVCRTRIERRQRLLLHARPLLLPGTEARFISRDPIGLAGGLNIYAYAGDDPTDVTDPQGLWGFGFIGQASYEAGLGPVAVGGSSSAGFGYFSSGGWGRFKSSGSFDFGPNGQTLSPPSPGSTASAWGGSAGIGGGFVYSYQAQTVADFKGPFRTSSFTIGGWTFQRSVGQNAKGETIYVYAWMPFGYAPGVSASASNTNTTTWRVRGFLFSIASILRPGSVVAYSVRPMC
jgi:hypothetical protein